MINALMCRVCGSERIRTYVTCHLPVSHLQPTACLAYLKAQRLLADGYQVCHRYLGWVGVHCPLLIVDAVTITIVVVAVSPRGDDDKAAGLNVLTGAQAKRPFDASEGSINEKQKTENRKQKTENKNCRTLFIVAFIGEFIVAVR